MARVSSVGCFPEDALLFRKGGSGPRWQFLLPWRASLWGRTIGRLDLEHSRLGPENTDGYPVLTPTDFQALVDVRGAVHSNAFLQGLVETGPDPKLEQPELLYRLRRFALAGLDLRPLREVDDEGDARIVAHLIAQRNLTTMPLPVRLLMIAIQLGRPLSEIADRFSGYAANAGYPLPEFAESDVPDLVPTFQDVAIVSKDLDGSAPWNIPPTAGAVRRAAKRLGEPMETVRGRFAAYTRLGFPPVAVESPDTPDEDPAALALFEFLDRVTGPPQPQDIAELVYSLRVSEREAFHMAVKATEPLGLRTAAEMADLLPADSPDAADYALFGRLIRSRWPCGTAALAWIVRDRREHLSDAPVASAVQFYGRHAYLFGLPDQLVLAHLVVLASRLRTSVGHAASVAAELFPNRMDPESALAMTEAVRSLRPTDNEARALIQTASEQAVWKSPSAEEVASLAVLTARTVGQVLEALSAYTPLGAQVPKTGAELAGYMPDDYDVEALKIAIPVPGEMTVSALRLVRAAGRQGWTVRHAHDRLSRFRELGVRLEPSRDDCPDTIVHWADLIVLSRYFDGDDPGRSGTVTADDIVRAASVVKETPADARGRLLQYASSFGLDCEELP